jgi:hypothetical protein
VFDSLDHLVAIDLDGQSSPAKYRFIDDIAVLSRDLDLHLVSKKVVVVLSVGRSFVRDGLGAAVISSRFDGVSINFVARMSIKSYVISIFYNLMNIRHVNKMTSRSKTRKIKFYDIRVLITYRS